MNASTYRPSCGTPHVSVSGLALALGPSARGEGEGRGRRRGCSLSVDKYVPCQQWLREQQEASVLVIAGAQELRRGVPFKSDAVWIAQPISQVNGWTASQLNIGGLQECSPHQHSLSSGRHGPSLCRVCVCVWVYVCAPLNKHYPPRLTETTFFTKSTGKLFWLGKWPACNILEIKKTVFSPQGLTFLLSPCEWSPQHFKRAPSTLYEGGGSGCQPSLRPNDQSPRHSLPASSPQWLRLWPAEALRHQLRLHRPAHPGALLPRTFQTALLCLVAWRSKQHHCVGLHWRLVAWM